MEQIDHRAVDLDEKDLELLEYVETDFDMNLEQLSNELDLSKSAVHYRLNKLRDKNIIQATTADIDPLACGLNMMAITNVVVAHESGYAEDIGTQLAGIKGVQKVYYTMGDVDFVILSRVQNRDQLNTLIDTIVSIDGVNETSSRFVMQELKTDARTISNMSAEMRKNVFDHTD
jgi:Lrp/AsnC family leucine-responsive transcriptional regulator